MSFHFASRLYHTEGSTRVNIWNTIPRETEAITDEIFCRLIIDVCSPLVILKLIFFKKNNSDVDIKTDKQVYVSALLSNTTSCQHEDRLYVKVCAF